MRNAALVLGIIAGIVGMIVGFFGWGYTAAIEQWGELDGLAEQVDNVDLVRSTSLMAPLLAIAGGAMARARALWGGALLLISAVWMYVGFGFNVFTMFPIAFAGLAGVLAIAAGKPDEEKAHF
ncbi:hypothetical protein [Cognatishimia activa]|uniref:Uncharacterized protein n=1 Tax=Cognatishimia activa TaxID=1715691 RepID=A0A0P1J7N0_9RHOB|nr:hypothetical protein [Cognatishimia activa]MEE2945236.1 hypothetical protein [Pseudomonadota bacterium]CUJ11430.1 hypothetical protein TA5113_02326 [Cognatishimia activa]CUK25773.1 hypothetical protein TA5114_01577 [Cognatishimia activa]